MSSTDRQPNPASLCWLCERWNPLSKADCPIDSELQETQQRLKIRLAVTACLHFNAYPHPTPPKSPEKV